jgi:cytochrome c553
MRLLRQLRAVLWSLIGIRRRADAMRDVEGSHPAVLVGLAIFVVAMIVLGIATLVHFVARRDDGAAAGRGASAPAAAAPRSTVAQEPVRVADTMAARTRACTGCHGTSTAPTRDGFSPRLAGKPAGYLYNQLASFRDGRRTYAPMVYLVQYMTDDYLHEIADYFAGLDLPYAPPEPLTLTPAANERARTLVEHGDPARDLPACSTCHGTSLAGVKPAIPGLLGLPRHYIAAQLGAWRSGRLRSVPPDCMGEVARRLAPEDVATISAWLAAEPVVPGMRPEAASTTQRLPLTCGSVEAAMHAEGAGGMNATPAATMPAAASSTPTARTAGDTPAARGRYLVSAGDCIACHTSIGGAPFAGGRGIDTPFGTVYSTNLTPDPQTGIGTWSADDFWRALHEGRGKDGRLLYPAFPYPNFTRVSREDSDAMFAYLRTLTPVKRQNRAHALSFPYRTQVALAAWRALYFRPGSYVPDASKGDQWNRGAYLVQGLGHCDACHGNRNFLGAVQGQLDLGGGLIPMQNWYAPPLISARRAGVASWSPDEVSALLRTGVSRRATAMGPMAEVVFRSTQHLSAADAKAIAAYLASLGGDAAPAVQQPGVDAGQLEAGRELYANHCADCHGADGEGAFPAYPPLARNPGVAEASAASAAKAVLYGGYAPVTAGNPRPYGMPPYFNTLSDADIAAILTYVRASWGNAAAPVSALDVERVR